ncbi:MAG: hypothetical protein U5K27_01280 [Desulfotignum sp.]|nr:hypothetical protein [Desulfotignum sp.]
MVSTGVQGTAEIPSLITRWFYCDMPARRQVGVLAIDLTELLFEDTIWILYKAY